MKICEREGVLAPAFCWSFLGLGLSSLTRIAPNGLKVLFFLSSVALGLALLSKSNKELRPYRNDYFTQNSWKGIKSLLWPWVGLFTLYALSVFWSAGSVETFVLNLYEYRTLLAVPLFTWCLVIASANDKYFEVIFSLGVIVGCFFLYGNFILGTLAIDMGALSPRGSHIVGGTISSFGVVLTLHLSSRVNGNQKWFLIVCAVMLSTFVLYIDIGRTGYLQIISVWTLWVFFTVVRFKVEALISLFFVILVVVLLSDSTVSRMHMVLGNINLFLTGAVDSSSGLRLEAWRFSIHKFFDAPIFGHGLGSYQLLLSESYDNGLFRWRTDNLHTELGNTMIIGGGFALLLFFAICISPIRFVFKVGPISNLKFLACGSSVVFIISALFNSVFKDFGEKHMIMVMFPYLFISMLKFKK